MQLNEVEIQQKQAAQQRAALEKQSGRIGAARLVAVLVIFLALVAALKGSGGGYYLLAAVGAVAFVLLLVKHQQIKAAVSRAKQEEGVLGRYAARFGKQWQSFEQDGTQFLRSEEPQSVDLDIFGPASLYQYVSVAHTLHGQEALADLLRQPELSVEKIVSRQQAVKELAGNWPLAVEFEALSAEISKGKQHLTMEAVERFLKYGERSGDELPRGQYWLSWLLPAATAVALVLAALQMVSGIWPAVLIVVQLGLSMLGYGQMMAVLEPLYSLHNSISAYDKLFAKLEETSFESEYLQTLQGKLSTKSGAATGIQKLHKIGQAVSLRYNVLLYWPACGLLMWNHHCVSALAKWKDQYGRQMRKWMEATGEFEALLSLAVLCQVKETYCFPDILPGDRPAFKGTDIAHPLLESDKVVANSAGLTAQTCVITGSNMSGKTTFLRSIGVNLVLAYAGGPVCANTFETTLMKVFTSMRVHDDVSQGISTFYAELLRIKQMVVYSEKRRPMLVLIDEIFKGTNSADRLVGAKAVITKLSQPWCITLVSTHDFELCDLEKDPAVKAVNYHFSEYYVDDEIRFDYLMQPGRCQTTNAQQLMRMAGLM